MYATLLRSILVSAAVFAFAPGAAAVEETPMSIPGGTYVGTDQAREQFNKGALFVDARVGAEYADKHIKGAVNVTYKEKHGKVSTVDPEDKFDLAKLPADKAKAMVFYCNGSPCWRGYKAAAAAIKAGYKSVLWYRDGMPDWVAKGHPVE